LTGAPCKGRKSRGFSIIPFPGFAYLSEVLGFRSHLGRTLNTVLASVSLLALMGDFSRLKVSFPTGKTGLLQRQSLPFAGHFLDYFARLRRPISVPNLRPSLLISDRV